MIKYQVGGSYREILLTALLAQECCILSFDSNFIFQGGGCKWWHFYPYEGVKELEEKFQEIMRGDSNNFFLDKLLSGVKQVQKNVFQQLFTKEEVIKEDPSGELEIWTDHKSR